MRKEESNKKDMYIESGLFYFSVDKEILNVNLSDISYIKCDGNYCELMVYEGTKLNTYLIRKKIKQFESVFSDNYFIEIHRSYIVNTNAIERFSNNYVYIADRIIPISRGKAQNLKKILAVV